MRCAIHGAFDHCASVCCPTTTPATAKTAAQLLNPIKSTATVTENIKMSTFGDDNMSADSDSFDDEGPLEEPFYDEVAADPVREDPVVPIVVDQHVPDVSISGNATTDDVILTGLTNENFDAATLICRYTPVEKCGFLVNGLLYGIVALLHVLSAVIFGLKSGGYFAKLY